MGEKVAHPPSGFNVEVLCRPELWAVGRKVTAVSSGTNRQADREQSAEGSDSYPCPAHTGHLGHTWTCFLQRDINTLRGFVWHQGLSMEPLCVCLSGALLSTGPLFPCHTSLGEVLVVIRFSFMRMNCN